MARKIGFREPAQRFLIVCEGRETEPLYFRAFRVPGDVKNIDVEGLGKSTISLVKAAIQLKKKDDYDQVWVVFDIDDCLPQQVNTAMQLAQQNGIEVVYSNQAFELWYILHFDYHQTAVSRDQYNKKLSKLLEIPYKKNTPGLYRVLLNKQDAAIERAKKIFATYVPPDPCADDPCTTVFRLVEALNQFTPDSRRKKA